MDLEAADKMAVYDLDFDVLIDLILNLPLASAGLRHTSMTSSLAYIHPVPDRERELRFVKDLFTLSTAKMIERWYGGRENADRFNADLMDGVVDQYRKAAAALAGS